ncbi:MAG: DNA/RNA non-specific endonuclease [Alistipes putredinis]|nr:MAG: DNA/RNA non-specific endonuclease [Alistipes putredinis]
MKKLAYIFSVIISAAILAWSCDEQQNGTSGQAGDRFAVQVNGASMITSSSAVVGGTFFSVSTGPFPSRWESHSAPKNRTTNTRWRLPKKSRTHTLSRSGRLEAGTAYKAKAYVQYDDGQMLFSSSEISFTTLRSGIDPVTVDVTTIGFSELSHYGARLSGSYTVSPQQDIDEAGFAYRKFDAQSYAHISGSTTGNEFSVLLSSCQPSTTYYYKAYVVLNGTRYYGAEKSFTTTANGGDEPTTQKYSELPKLIELDGCQYVTHFIPGTRTRNYSICWNRDKLIPMWVAYPMHRCYDGSAGRNYVWNYDPQIPSSYQPNLGSSYLGSYSRGHMIASSDRQVSPAANRQTFYYTNMCPQIQNEFNGGVWQSLEKRVQSYDWICDDTLYVVSGAAMIGDYKYTSTKKQSKRSPYPLISTRCSPAPEAARPARLSENLMTIRSNA